MNNAEGKDKKLSEMELMREEGLRTGRRWETRWL